MTSNTLELNPTHPLVSELSNLRLAVSRFQDEAYTTSVKLQRQSLESANAHDRVVYLERENEVLRTELAVLRVNPHPDSSLQAHPAVAQVQQLTLSLRKLSDKLSLTEAALLDRTIQFSHAAAEASQAKLTAEAAYELAARTRGREEAGKLRELELEQKVKAAEEAVKMSDLVVNEYADLVRSLQADKTHSRLIDGLAEGKLGLHRLLNEFNSEIARLQKDLLETQGALAVAKSQRDSEKKHEEKCRVELAQVQFELQQLKLDDNVAAKMVSRYMKFSQKSTDNLSEALSALKTRHSATTSTLSSQLLSLRSQLHASSNQTETLRRALDELGGELTKEAFGRRMEVALRIRMVNREEKIHGELERWVIKAEEAQARAQAEDDVGVNFEKMVSTARKVLDGTFGGEDGELGRAAVVEAAIRELTLELESEMEKRLELERIVALTKAEEAAVVDGTVGDAYSDGVVERPEQPPEQSVFDVPVQDDTCDTAPVLVSAPAPDTQLLTAREAASSSKSTFDDLAPLTNSITSNDFHELQSDSLTTSPLISDIVNDKDHLSSLPIPSSAPNGTTTHELKDTSTIALSADGPNNPEVSTETVVEPLVVITPPQVSLNGNIHRQDLVLTDGKTPLEEDSSTNEIPEHTEFHINGAFQLVISSDVGGNLSCRPDSASPEDQLLLDGVIPNGHTSSDREAKIADPDPTPDFEHVSPPTSDLAHDTLSSPSPQRTSAEQEASKPPAVSDVLPPLATTPSPSPLTISLDTPSPAHPLFAELAKTKHRYNTLQRSLRDCHLALESLSASLESTVTGGVPAEALRTAVQRLNDYTEDARVELEIRIADEALIEKGFEIMLCVPGALATPSLHEGQEKDQDPMTHLDVEGQVEAFVNGTDPTVNKAIRSLSRKLEDIEHDIAVLQRSIHGSGETDGSLVSSPSSATDKNNEGGRGGGWTSWIRSTPTSPSPLHSPPFSSPPSLSASSLGPAPTFGSVISSPRLRPSPSLNFSGGKTKGTDLDPLANLGLRVPMPSYIQHQGPAAVQPRSRTFSTMYMLGLGARSVSGSGSGGGSGFFGSPRKEKAAPVTVQNQDDSDEADESEESDVE